MDCKSNDSQRLYSDLAWIWPIISPKEDYISEAEEFRSLFLKHSLIKVKSVLHLGCGGGHTDFTMKRYFKLTGLDTSSAMLKLARKLNPEVNYVMGDMRSIRLGNMFDAVLCADSISYMRSEDELSAVFTNAFEHLNPGGVFCTYAEITVEILAKKHGKTDVSTRRQGDVEIVFIDNYYDPEPDDSTFEYTFVVLIRRAGELSIETDRHLMHVFDEDVWLRLLEKAGFEVITPCTRRVTARCSWG